MTAALNAVSLNAATVILLMTVDKLTLIVLAVGAVVG
jgi:hypothetical protein